MTPTIPTKDPNFDRDLYDNIEIDYEHAYAHCPPKLVTIQKALTLLPPNSTVLDAGCGTGYPTISHLTTSNLNLSITGIDISPKMISHTASRFPGTFLVADMLTYTPPHPFAAIFLIYSHLSLLYTQFHSLAHKLANALEPGGILVIGQSPADSSLKHVEDSAYDDTGSYVEGYNVPFMGKDFPTLMLKAAAQREFVKSMGLEIVFERIEVFQPDSPIARAEEQQYLIARRPVELIGDVPKPLPLPK